MTRQIRPHLVLAYASNVLRASARVFRRCLSMSCVFRRFPCVCMIQSITCICLYAVRVPAAEEVCLHDIYNVPRSFPRLPLMTQFWFALVSTGIVLFFFWVFGYKYIRWHFAARTSEQANPSQGSGLDSVGPSVGSLMVPPAASECSLTALLITTMFVFFCRRAFSDGFIFHDATC